MIATGIATLVAGGIVIIPVAAIPIAGELAVSCRYHLSGAKAGVSECVKAETAKLPDKVLAYRVYLAHLGVPPSRLTNTSIPDDPLECPGRHSHGMHIYDGMAVGSPP